MPGPGGHPSVDRAAPEAAASPGGPSAALAAARGQFRPEPGVVYLDSATYGLPPLPTVRALHQAVEDWQAGSARWVEDWDRPTDSCRSDFAALIGATAAEIASIPALSVGAGIVADSVRPGDEVVVPADEFTSTMFPVLVAAEAGAVVREVPFEDIASAIGSETRLVAFSFVQMQTGKVADMPAILEAAGRYGTRVFVDATQAVPFVDVEAYIEGIDYLACAAYKHLLSPRGVAFLYVRRDRWSELRPLVANWRAASDPYGRYFGGPLSLADDAARFDVSRAWFPWLGAAESLRLLVEWRGQGLFEEVRVMTERLAGRLGVSWHGSSLVCPPIRAGDDVVGALRAAGVRAAVRGTAMRLAVHVYSADDDLDRAADVILPFIERSD